MKLIKKWLFPILTCLIIVGAAVLPPYISQVRDSKQFGQIHAEELNADILSAREPPDLLERLELYARWCTPTETIPSFQNPETDVDLAEQALERLVQAGVIPGHLLWDSVEQADATRLLLWNPTDSMGNQTPIEFWRVKVYLGDRSLSMDLDGEAWSNFPVSPAIRSLARLLFRPAQPEQFLLRGSPSSTALGLPDGSKSPLPWHSAVRSLC